MAKKSVPERVIQGIADAMNLEESEVKEESLLEENLGMDSLDLVEGTMNLEEEFSIDIPDEDLPKLLSVKDVIEYIKARLKSEPNK